MYRQGDVLIVPINQIPKDVKPIPLDNDRIVLAYGEVTGHAHAIKSKTTSFWTTDAGKRYLQVKVQALLKHEEHSEIVLPAGDYEVFQQREYTPEAIRNVAD